MWRLGLTGGIGSGKSTVARLLQTQGAAVIDADAIARACTASGGAAIPAIVARFGDQLLTPDGAMDRARMREIAFGDPAARLALEAIVHPIVQQNIRDQADRADSPCLVFDIPLLVESAHWRHQLDSVLVVDCTEHTQIARVQSRSGWDEAAVLAVIRQQSSRERRLQAADGVLWNDGIDLPTLSLMVQTWGTRFGL